MAGHYEVLDSVRQAFSMGLIDIDTIRQDEYRLPEGLQRIGYDADTQIYTYQDTDGSYWEGEEGNRYGQLHRVSQAALPSRFEFEVRLTQRNCNSAPFSYREVYDIVEAYKLTR